MAAETTRVKDIPTTATTAAADDYVLLDGATNGTRKGLASNLITPAAHNADATAHLNIVRRTLAGDLTLTAADYQYQRIIPDADRYVVLPAESTAQWAFLLCHAGGSYNLTVKRAGGTTVGIMIPGSSLAAAWDGTGFGIC